MKFSNVKCPKCERTNNFKAETIEVRDYKYKLTAICCASCNTVISVLEYYNIGAVLNQIKAFFKIK